MRLIEDIKYDNFNAQNYNWVDHIIILCTTGSEVF